MKYKIGDKVNIKGTADILTIEHIEDSHLFSYFVENQNKRFWIMEEDIIPVYIQEFEEEWKKILK